MLRYLILFTFFLHITSSLAQNFSDDTPIVITYYAVKNGDNLYKIAQNFDLGFDEILQANPDIADHRFIRAQQIITLPTIHLIPDINRVGIVINLAELRLYFFSDDDVESFPISIGADEKTPIGKTKIAAKREKPTWTPPASIREENPNLPDIVLAGPNNPLGNYALYLDGSRNYKWQGIMIHGTNAPRSIGSRVSHGCIRLYPQDIKNLFNKIEINTPVEIINQPLKISEINGKVYLESHLKEAPELIFEGLGVKKLICKKIENCETRINWEKVDRTVTQNLGIPVEIDFHNSELEF